MIPQHNKAAPHTGLIFLAAEIHEKLPSGECSGNPVYKTSATLAVDGCDYEMCLRKLNEFIAEMKTCSKNK